MEHYSQSPFEAIGGERKIEELVEEFYQKVKQHPDLAPIFPDDLTETARKQKQFLTQFLGGPPAYSQEHGHPMLRARHLPFEITPKRAEAWLSCLHDALNKININTEVRDYIFQRLSQTAHHMVNTKEPS